jgi:cytidylate kinase
MDQQQQQTAPATMRAITVSREYGSGGGEIARRLADRLGWHLLDRQIVEEVAQRLGVSPGEAAGHDEHVEGLVMRLFSSMQYVMPAPPLGDTPYASSRVIDDSTYQEALRQALLAAAQIGQAVIVGRGGQAILASHRDVLHVRVVAPLDRRIAYVMRRESLDAPAAQARIHQRDHARHQHMHDLYHSNEQDPAQYDLVVNTGVLDLDSVVDLVLLALERKATRLAASEEELGPGTGLAPYPSGAGDH